MSVLLLIVDFAVILALTVFLMLVIRGLAQAVKARLKRGFADSLATYDGLIGERSRALQELESLEAASSKAPGPAPTREAVAAAGGAADPLPTAPFAHGEFARSYRMVRDTFAFAPADALGDALRRAPAACAERAARCEAARAVRAQLDHDTLFELLSLPHERQLDVLREALVSEQRDLLDDFCAQRGWTDALEFVHWLDAVALATSDEVVVTVGAHEQIDARSLRAARPVRVRTSPDVCEGVLVRVGGTLYDYALRSKDLQ